jgi:monoamine oxidase
MARTGLFHGVERALRLARAAERGSASTATVLEHYALRAERRSRRAFLKGMLAAGAAAGGCGRAATPSQAAAEICVVGAGIAGLTCAYRLKNAGLRVRLFEAQERVGGRMFTLRDHFPERHVVELGGEMIDSGHTNLRGLAGELGLALDDLSPSSAELAQTLWYFAGSVRSEAEVVDAFRPVAHAIERDLATIGEGSISFRTPLGAEALDRESLAAWFDRHGVRDWIRALLDVAYTTEMGLESAEQSALNLLTFIATEPDPFRVFGESDERYHVRGGSDAITRALATRLGAAVETGCVLESVHQRAGGDFTLSFRRDNASRALPASHVVLALPLTTLRRVKLDVELPEVQRDAVRELAYGTNAKLLIGFARRQWREATRSDGSTFSDLAYQTTWEATRAQPGESGVLVNFTGGRQGQQLGTGSAADRARSAVEDLERLFPGISALRTGMTEARFHWPSHPWALGSYMCPRPGDWTRFGGAFDKPAGRLRFAGEHTSSEAQGFMEGGCESGERVAAELLRELGVVSARRAAAG